MSTANLDTPAPCEELGTIRIPVDVPGHVVDGTDGLIGVRAIRLKWEDGQPECVGGLGIALDIDSLGGAPFGPERDGLPCWLMAPGDSYTWEDPEEDHAADATDRTLWKIGVSQAWVVTAIVCGKAGAVLHRLPDAEWLARHLYETMPRAFGAADREAFRAAVPKSAGEWVRLSVHLLNHGIPRALIVTCKEYLERRKPD
jgi:hypothetical protein